MSPPVRILIADPLHEAGLEILRRAGADLHLLSEGERPRLGELLGRFDAVVVRSATRVDRSLLEGAGGLKVIGRAGIGVDNVDVAAATEMGMLVVNAPTANLVSATEHTFALLLALVRNVPQAHESLRRGEWERKRFQGSELQGKSLGVIGLGRIGQGVARRARAFDMEVIAYDPFLDPGLAERLGVELLPLEELLPRADMVTLHTPLTDATRNLIDAGRVALMKRGAMLVNCGRGGVLDEQAVLEALESGHLGGVALDVFAQEPPVERGLVNHPRVVVTPHIGAQTREAQERVATETARMVLAALDGSLAVTAVNLPFRPTGAQGEVYLRLGEQLGRLASSLLGGSLTAVRVDLWGLDEELRVPVSVAVLKGSLLRFLGEGVNYVNAERVAESRGIEVVRSTHQGSSEYAHLVAVEVVGEGGACSLAGTLFGGRNPRIVQFEEYPLEFRPEGRLLVVQNRDVPGVVGRLGGLLGAEGINIADIHLARREQGDLALAVVRLDQQPGRGLLAAIEELSEVESVRYVDLG